MPEQAEVDVGHGFQLPAAIAEVFITDELSRRAVPAPDYLREKLAIQDLAAQMADHPSEVLPRLVQLALEICNADSAGISVLEGDHFRWFNLKGQLAAFEGTTTPRNDSPCGVCLDQRSPVLMEHPERAYGWIADARVCVPEVLLVPLLIDRTTPLGTLWVIAREGQRFNRGHARVLSELAVFTGIALRMIQADVKLKKALEEQETLTKEMSHRVKNLFAMTDSMIRMTARNSTTKEQMAESLSGRLRALSDAHSLVRRSFNPETHEPVGVELSDVISTVLRPHRNPVMNGAHVQLGERATNSVALVFHELATNASKYGALSVEGGTVYVDWTADGDTLVLTWRETGGPPVMAPKKNGFGTALVRSTIAGHGGTIESDWAREGLTARISVPLSSLVH
jgi:two-component sensor histidine kinase